MAVLIDARGLHKAYSGKVLMDDVSIAITDRMKLGLVGANGAGKSTLLKLIQGEEEPDLGQVTTHNDLRVGHLPQHDPFTEGESIADFLERWSGREPWTCAAMAARFGIDAERIEEPILSCSGGWRTRAKLCAVLLQEPNLLILDEPTNFLDLRTQLLLSHFLSSWNGAALVVSHDRSFLQRTTTHTAELNGGQIRLHSGPIEDAMVAWKEEEERLMRRAASLESKTKQLQRFVDSNRANASTASQARSKAKQIERLNEEKPIVPSSLSARATVRVPQVERRDGPACHVNDLDIGYGTQVIASCPHLELLRGERLAIMGDNGQGKTTFLRSICGDLSTLAGEIRWTHGAEIAVYAQHVYKSLGNEGTVHDHLSKVAGGAVSTQEVLDIAGSFLFRGDEVHKPLNVCSGGERARAVLAGILLTKATVLILDEPTNHLDVATVESLLEALKSYGGTVLVASHDARFVENLCTGIIQVGDGNIARWPGSTSDYCQDMAAEIQAQFQGKSSLKKQATDGNKAAAKTGKQQPGYAQKRREFTKAISSSERSIARHKQRIEQLQTELSNTPADQQANLHQELSKAQQSLDQAEEIWLQASADLETLEAD